MRGGFPLLGRLLLQQRATQLQGEEGVPCGLPGSAGSLVFGVCRDVGTVPSLEGPCLQKGAQDPPNAGGALGGPGWTVPTKLEWILQGFQLQGGCWEEAGTGGGDGDTHSGVGAPSLSSAPHHPWGCARGCGAATRPHELDIGDRASCPSQGVFGP